MLVQRAKKIRNADHPEIVLRATSGKHHLVKRANYQGFQKHFVSETFIFWFLLTFIHFSNHRSNGLLLLLGLFLYTDTVS